MMVSFYSRNILRSVGLILFFVVIVPLGAWATHMRAGNILLEKKGDCQFLTYDIVIVAYIDTESEVPFGGADTDVLFIFGRSGWGQKIRVPEITKKSANGDDLIWELIDDTRHIARVVYRYRNFVFPGNDTYTVSYTEINRNGGILNMSRSVDTPFYIETKLTLDAYLGCSTPANIEVPPVDQACAGITWTHNPGATDEDSISYELEIPLSAPQRQVENYQLPNLPPFYTSTDYQTANEAGDSTPTFTIDPVEGTITWDAPGNAGEYNIAFHIIEWRKVDGKWYQMGYVRRDMQIIVEDDCKNNRPDLDVPEDICVKAGESVDEVIRGFDQPYKTEPLDNVTVEAFSQTFTLGATRTPESPSGPSPQLMHYHWKTECEDVRQQPYMVVFKVTDDGQPKLATFKTWRIRVVGPEPVWNDRKMDTSGRGVVLKWDPYVCQNADSIRIYRRVDSVAFTPDKCQTGMPPGLGYEQIDVVPASQATYTDNDHGRGLASGARYCYRLVAVYPQPSGGESIVSSDTCIGPIITHDPIITEVSVKKTDIAAGQIEVGWHRPLDAVAGAAYKYDVYRGEDFSRGSDSVLVKTILGSTTDIESFVDDGLNTEEKVYNYSIVSTSPDAIPVKGYSKSASSVRLDNESQIGKIILTWKALVPWSNQITDPTGKKYRHRIYKGPEGSTDEQLIDTIATIDPTLNGLTFTDNGPFPTNDKYCYRVETYGSYGNPDLPDPLINSSQRICTLPGDSVPPCAVTLNVELAPCEQLIEQGLLCSANQFENTLTWERPQGQACDDIRWYEIWYANIRGGTYALLKDKIPVTTTTYVDKNLISYARCYKIRAVDASGNVGDFSSEVCNDNCPFFALPNVFTPNGDGKNDVLDAYNTLHFCPEGNDNGCAPPLEVLQKCARFVENVKFTVYNRWGQQVYSYQSDTGGENTIYIDWNGKDSSGSLVAAGVYYYVAEVTFDTVNPKERVKTYKSWVHVLYGESNN